MGHPVYLIILVVPLLIGVLFYVWPVAMLFILGMIGVYSGFFLAIGVWPSRMIGEIGFNAGVALMQSGLLLLAAAGALSAILKVLRPWRPDPYNEPRITPII